jgi:hypothetical protein
LTDASFLNEAATMAVALDTLAYARRLREAGFSEQQAEGQAEALAFAMTDTLATKVDLQALATRQDLQAFATKQDLQAFATKQDLQAFATKQELQAFATKRDLETFERRMDAKLEEKFLEADRRLDLRFEQHTAKFDARLADLERRMTMRLGGMMAAGIAFLSAVLKMT